MKAPGLSPEARTARQEANTRHRREMRRMAWNIKQIDRTGESWWYRRWGWHRDGKWS